jgi:hypothetical protein
MPSKKTATSQSAITALRWRSSAKITFDDSQFGHNIVDRVTGPYRAFPGTLEIHDYLFQCGRLAAQAIDKRRHLFAI